MPPNLAYRSGSSTFATSDRHLQELRHATADINRLVVEAKRPELRNDAVIEIGVMIRLDKAKVLVHVSAISTTGPLVRNRGRHVVLVSLRQERLLAGSEGDLEASAVEALLNAAGLGAVIIPVGREPADVAGEVKGCGAVGKEVESDVRCGAVACAEVADNGAADHLGLRGVALLDIGVGEVDGLDAVEAEVVVVEDGNERCVRIGLCWRIIALRVAGLDIEGIGVVGLGSSAVVVTCQAEDEVVTVANVAGVSLAALVTLVMADLCSQIRSAIDKGEATRRC